MSARHTPGPWKHVLRTQEGNEVLGSDGKQVAAASGDSPEEEAANAHLIAAAPDLLAALEDIVAWHDETAPASRKMDAARAALAKAKGEKL